MKALSPSQKLIKSLVLAELQQDVHVFSIFEKVLEPYDVVVVKTAMDLDLGHELLLGAGLGEGRLRDHFCC